MTHNTSLPMPARVLLDFIGDIEAPKGYGTVYGNNQGKLAKPLTEMTLDEVIASGRSWSRKWKSSAAGRYQFMNATLKELKTQLRLSGGARFDPIFQDKLGLALLVRRGYSKWLAGTMSRDAFALGLAQEWASLPVLKGRKGQKRQVKRGQSYYAGDGLNKSLVKATEVEAMLERAWEARHVPAPPPPPPPPPPPAPPMPDPVIEPEPPFVNRARIADVQASLDAMGYPVGSQRANGTYDGIFGNMTRDAILGFRADRGMALVEDIDAGLLAALATAEREGWTRPISDERATATHEDVAEKSKTMHATWWGKLAALIGLGGGTAAEVVSEVVSEERLSTFQTMLNFVTGNLPILIGVALAGAGVYVAFKLVDRFKVQDFREGKRL
jgi:muramidase (phage lysozyme)